MSLDEYITKQKIVAQHLLKFLDDINNPEDSFIKLINIIDDQSIHENKDYIATFFHLLINITNNHHRTPDFFSKIDRILKHLQSNIQQLFTNNEIFNFFKSNKRVLLFLIKEEILKLDESITSIISEGWYKASNYHYYFYPEIKNLLNETKLNKMTENQQMIDEINSNSFEENRKRGENHNYICQLIQKDNIDEFVIYVNKTNLPLSKTIEKSIFETNSYLLNKEMTLIEYAAFYGSIQIFKYLSINNVDILLFTWSYAIHGRNPEMIHLLEKQQDQPSDGIYNQCLNESIKCHHNEIAHYLQDNLLNEQKNLPISIKYYNYEFYPHENFDEIAFYYACKYNNIFLVNHILDNSSIDINASVIDGYVQQTALNAAVKERNKEIVKILLSKISIDVNAQSYLVVQNNEDDEDDDINDDRLKYYKERNPLIIAVCQNDEEIVKLLLSNPYINVNAQLQYYDQTRYSMHHINKTALNIAIEKRNENIVEILLNHPNIEVNLISKHNDGDYGIKKGQDRYIDKVPLILAIESENIKIISLLLNHPNINVNIKSRYHDFVYIELYGYRGNQFKERTALSIAVERNNIEIVKLLMKHSEINLNYRLLFYNSNHDDVDEDKYKSDYYVYEDDFYGDDCELIEFEKIKNIFSTQHSNFKFEFIEPKMLFSRNFIKEIKTPLFVSVERQYIDLVHILLNCPKIDVNYKSIIKSTSISEEISPLHQAIKNGNVEIIQLLKDHNALDIKENYRDELDLLI